MARVHTDFIVLDEQYFNLLIDSLSEYFPVHHDVPLSRQVSLENNLNLSGYVVLKRKYVK